MALGIQWSDVKPSKVLHQWPLSRVELARAGDGFYVLKTIHKDFMAEIDRQRALRAVCRTIGIPEIFLVRQNKETASFLMEYVPHKKEKVRNELAIELICKFHEEAQDAQKTPFKTYNFKAFHSDFTRVKLRLPEKLREKNKEQLQEFFTPVFNSNQSIVHGDWHADQILKADNTYYIIDFGKSFFGPAILDHGTYFRKTNRYDNIACNQLGISRTTFLKSKVVANIIVLAWFELCKTKYIRHDFKKEIGDCAKLIQNQTAQLHNSKMKPLAL